VHAKAAGLYMICTMSKHAAEGAGFHDALMYDYRGRIAESTGANIFFVIDGEIHTPEPDCFLDGITRRTVIGLAREAGMTVIERPMWPDDLEKATEVFITGTAAEVTPVGLIDSRTYTPGKITETLIDAYTRAVNAPSATASATSAAE
jgi:branched-chain amino acid aminotransferase